MRRLNCLAFIALVLFGLPNDIDASPGDGFGFIRTGEFAFYRDTRGSMNFLRGVASFTADERAAFFLFNRDLTVDVDYTFLVWVSFSNEDGYTIDEIRGASRGLPPAVAQSWIDVLNFLSMRMSVESVGIVPEEYEDPWENYTQVFRFSSVFPVFGFDQIRLSDHSEPSYALVRVGRTSIDDVGTFIAAADVARPDSLPTPPPALHRQSPATVDLGPLSVELDSNWQESGCCAGPAYWLSVRTVRDSQIMLERIDLSRLDRNTFRDIADFARFMIGYDTTFPDSLSVRPRADGFEVEFRLLDDRSIPNITRLRFWQVDDDWFLLNFSSFADIYDSNSEYFDAILESARRTTR